MRAKPVLTGGTDTFIHFHTASWESRNDLEDLMAH